LERGGLNFKSLFPENGELRLAGSDACLSPRLVLNLKCRGHPRCKLSLEMKSLDCFRLLLVDNEQFDDYVASLPLIMRMCNTIELLLSSAFAGLSRFLNVKPSKLVK
jgi:hypothetical protein